MNIYHNFWTGQETQNRILFVLEPTSVLARVHFTQRVHISQRFLRPQVTRSCSILVFSCAGNCTFLCLSTAVENGGKVGRYWRVSRGSCRARTTSCRLTRLAWKALQRHLWSEHPVQSLSHLSPTTNPQLRLIQTSAKIFFTDKDLANWIYFVLALSNGDTWVSSANSARSNKTKSWFNKWEEEFFLPIPPLGV